MAYVITEACSGAKFTNCVDVCPVDAFREGADMLYIDPDVCIDCNACLTECPVRAIYPQGRVPAEMAEYIAINATESKTHPIITERKVETDSEEVVTSSAHQQPHRFAIIGAGPSGFFAGEALLKQFPGSRIDLLEKLPAPFGLVRYGVAPDHQDMKSVSDKFSSLVLNNPRINFFGNVEIGKDLSRDELLQAYDYVIYTTGGSESKKLNLPGFETTGVHGASNFVGWYNGHPDHKSLAPQLNASCMAVIGMGNVALDIARIVCLPDDELSATDIADHAYTALTNSAIKTVKILARKGPAQAAFTPKELQQLIDNQRINLQIDAADLELDPAIEQSLELPENSEAKENIALLRQILTRKSDPDNKTIRFVFHASPQEISADQDGVSGLIAAKNTISLDNNQQLLMTPSGETAEIAAQIIINATGYQGQALDGLKFESGRGIIANQDGRVLLESGELSAQEYVAGWIKRGASGVIGTNKQCAVATVKTLKSDIEQNQQAGSSPSTDRENREIEEVLQRNQINWFSFADWMAIDSFERKQGRLTGKPRQKLIDLKDMLEVKVAYQEQKSQNKKTSTKPDSNTPAIKDYDASQPVKVDYRTCTLCEAMCGVKIEYQGEKIIAISGDKDNQHSNGHICPKGYALQDLHNDPERLRTPMKRVGDQWIPIDWDQALEEVAQRLVKTQKEHGKDAIATYWGNPASHNLGLMLTMGALKKALGSSNNFSATSLDQMPHQLTSLMMFGHGLLFSVPDIDRTDYMLMLGANPAASNGSLMTAGDVLGRMENIKERGGKLVLIDPRRTETALYASEHTFIKPGTDALFLLGLIQVIFNKGLTSPNSNVPLNGDIKDIEPLVNSIPLGKIAKITGIASSEIERIACEFAQAERAVCYGRMGMSTQQFGALNHWLMQVLNIVTGNLDQIGGMMFTTPAITLAQPNARGGFARSFSRVRKLPEFSRDYPTSTLADEMATPGEGQVKAFVCLAGNPVIAAPNSTKLERCMEQLDFMVSIDFYINETSKHADIILPPTGPFEHEQYDMVFNTFAVRNVTKFSDPMFPKKSYMRCDHEIVSTLIARLNQLKAPQDIITQLKLRAKTALSQQLTTERILDMGLRLGNYGDGWKSYLPFFSGKGLTLNKLREHKHGLDLGALEPRMPEILFTKDKKVQLMPAMMVEDLKRLQAFVETSNPQVLLIGRRDLRTNNSWMHNSQRLVKGSNRCDLFIHPVTAQQHGIQQGEQITVTSRVGQLTVTVALTEDIMPDVVSLPHGWGHHRDGMQISTASSNPGINVNDITDDELMDELSGNAAFNGVPVELERIF